MQLESMYQEIILDHYRNPHGRGLREPFEAEVHHVNPTCGDEVTLRVHLDGDTIADVSYEGMGCSISQASVSAMYDLVIGKTVPRGAGDRRALHDADAEQGRPVGRREARGRAGGRRRVRRRVEVPRADQVRADELDGAEGRVRARAVAQRPPSETEHDRDHRRRDARRAAAVQVGAAGGPRGGHARRRRPRAGRQRRRPGPGLRHRRRRDQRRRSST